MIQTGGCPVPAFAVFASGRGSNLRRLHAFFSREHPESGRICCVVTDKPDCTARTYADEEGIPVICVEYRGRTKAMVEAELVQKLSAFKPVLLVLAGYMRLLGPDLLEPYAGRIINIHPALLPRHPGAHGLKDSFDAGDAWVGITIHKVDAGMDTGPVIVQKSFQRKPEDTFESIEEKIHQAEHEMYPLAVKGILDHMRTQGGTE